MKILLICDNSKIIERIKEICKKKKILEMFHFRTSYNNPNKEVSLLKLKRINVNNEVKEIITNFNIVISAHCLQLFPKELVNSVKCINMHPGYNPSNRGWYPQVFSIINNKSIGATIHEMDEKLDHGKIIVQKVVKKNLWDTSLTLYNRVLDTELELFEKHIVNIINNKYKAKRMKSEGNINLRKDFIKLKEFKLNEKGTFLEFFNKLRALSHEPYKNAYVIDPKTKMKLFLNLNIDIEKDIKSK